MKTKISTFDFDGTLFDSPDRERGSEAYFNATGDIWPFSGWWGRPETLQHPVVPDPVPKEMFFDKIVKHYRDDYNDPNCHVVLLTGRPFKVRKIVQKILASQEISFHDEYYRGMPGSKGRDTLEIKLNIIQEHLIKDHTEIFEIWEDRPEHLSQFMTEFKRLKNRYKNLKKIIVHDAVNYLHYEF